MGCMCDGVEIEKDVIFELESSPFWGLWVWIIIMLKHLICVVFGLIFAFSRAKTKFTAISSEDSLEIKQDWDACCKKHVCAYNSCYFELRRASTWANVRQRCQGRYSDYPSSIDLFQIRNEDDLEIVSELFHEEKDQTSISKRIWTSGMKCPKTGPDQGIVYFTKWISSNEPLPEWLMNKIISPEVNTPAKNDDCQFLVIAPSKNVSEFEYEFQDQLSHHSGLCEFILPEEIQTIKPSNLTTVISTSLHVSEDSSTAKGTSSEITQSMTQSTSPKIKSKTLGPGEIYSTTEKSKQTANSSPSPNIESTTSEALKKFCKGKEVAGIKWPDTLPGVTVNRSCPEGMTGYAQWTCDESTIEFTPVFPIIQDCKHIWIKELEENVEKGTGKAIDISKKMSEETGKQNMSHGDISALIDLSVKIIHLFAVQREEPYNFTGSMVSSMSNILRTESKDAWTFLPPSHQTRAASQILQIVATIGSHLSCVKKTSENKLQYTVTAENIDLQTFILNKEEEEENDHLVFPQNVEGVKANSSLIVPANLKLAKSSSDCLQDANTAVGVLYKNVGDFLKSENESDSSKKVVTKVISFTLNNNSESVLLPGRDLVTIILRHDPVDGFQHHKLRCMFWNFSKASYGQWDGEGCFLVSFNETHVTCSCNHLTNFAVLMDVNNNVIEDEILSLLTYICCGLSSFSLVVTLICFISVKSLHGRRSIITGNLCVALLFTNLLVLFGLDETGNKVLCNFIAAFLHFWILSAFCWMLIEGYHLYKMVVLVFERGHQLSVRIYYLFSYGLPMLIVSISLGIRTDDYGGKTHCWLSSNNGLIWSFVGPACVIVLVNTVIFILTLRSASNVRIKKEQTTMKKIKNWAKGSMSVMCLLGLTWCLGLFYIDKNLSIFSYVFTVFNGSQGVLIFFFHILLNEKVYSLFHCRRNKKDFWRTCLPQTSSNQLHSKISTKTSTHSMGCVSCGVPAVNPRFASNVVSQQSSNRENFNINKQKIRTRKNWSSEIHKKDSAARTISENGFLSNPSTQHHKRSQSFPEERDNAIFENISHINEIRIKTSVRKPFC